MGHSATMAGGPMGTWPRGLDHVAKHRRGEHLDVDILRVTPTAHRHHLGHHRGR